MTDKGHDRLSEALARGRRAAEQLGAATDQLTETIARIERALEDLRLGVSSTIKICEEDEEMDNMVLITKTHLAFRKEGKRWMLFIDTATEPMLEEDWQSTTPLVNASRELRVRAVQFLPDLIDAMVAAAESRLAEVTDGQKHAETILAKLTPTHAGDMPRPIVKFGRKP